jgi:hypothetical protein
MNMTEEHILRHDFDRDPLFASLMLSQTRSSLRLLRSMNPARLPKSVAFAELCRKHGVKPDAADAVAQVELKMCEGLFARFKQSAPS